MIWNKYIIETTTKDSEMAAAILMEQGINDIQIEDNVQLSDEELNQMYADFVKELPADDGSCRINFYLEFDERKDNAAAQEEIIGRLRKAFKEGEELFGMEPVQICGEIVNSESWENNWKQYFKPFYVDDILIKPTWEPIPGNAQYVTCIDIDPGMAFGTGLHETTRLCIRGIRENLKVGDTVLDLGCGSGILSIASLKLGSGLIAAVDIDPQAVAVAEENFQVNGIHHADYELIEGNIMTDTALQQGLAMQEYNIVVANILAEVIAPLTAMVDKFMADEGLFIASGIIDDKETLCAEAVKANSNLELVDIAHDGDWVRIIARKVS